MKESAVGDIPETNRRIHSNWAGSPASTGQDLSGGAKRDCLNSIPVILESAEALSRFDIPKSDRAVL
jgi:hypothetical protein